MNKNKEKVYAAVDSIELLPNGNMVISLEKENQDGYLEMITVLVPSEIKEGDVFVVSDDGDYTYDGDETESRKSKNHGKLQSIFARSKEGLWWKSY